MKLRVVLTLLLAAAAFTAAPASAQNLTGTWQVTTEGRRGPQTQTLVLRQDANTVTGTITGGRGGGRGGAGGGGGTPQPTAISGGTVTGASFTFTVTREFGGNSISQTYSGTYEGDMMQGNIEGGRGGAQPFTGTRGD